MSNEGTLDERSISTEKVYTEDHPAIFLNGVLKTGHGAIKAGTVLSINAEGKVGVLTADEDIIGVAVEYVNADADYIKYLAHGTVIARKLIGTADAKFTDFKKLQKVGIYSL